MYNIHVYMCAAVYRREKKKNQYLTNKAKTDQ